MFVFFSLDAEMQEKYNNSVTLVQKNASDSEYKKILYENLTEKRVYI